MSTENIQKFLMPPGEGGAYTDEKLAALLAHAQDGKLSFHSCCCIAGIPSAAHPLQEGYFTSVGDGHKPAHPMTLPYPECKLADDVSEEFSRLGKDDAKRRERLIPLIIAEMERRDAKRVPSGPLIEDLIGAVELAEKRSK